MAVPLLPDNNIDELQMLRATTAVACFDVYKA